MTSPDLPVLVVPAAGYGTRMAALTGGGAKELLVLGHPPGLSVPCLLVPFLEALAAGIREAAVILRPGKEELRDVLSDERAVAARFPEAAEAFARVREGIALHFFTQAARRGEADAIHCAAPLLRGRALAVHYPDNVPVPGRFSAPQAESVFAPLLALAGDSGVPDCMALMEVTPQNMAGLSDSGRVDLEEHALKKGEVFRILDFLPKGPGPFTPRFAGELRTCGIYLAGRAYLEYCAACLRLAPEGEVTDGMVRRLMLDDGIVFCGARVPGTVHDVGNPKGYAACRTALAAARGA
ncbi:hypothetical protein dsx2_0477 [Desulfovibrio sp. X2]|uniref:hypothetical protein n=1 Tax=Desulfovibrio sp. X2 TaxID=941449 RepID=UPI0003588C82|nr:hypothetical protein [Desulfovibrio sp. X2]EPR38668.1 hypothetical protein dsx2_0477 [Desulfovibrio sp. X2]